MFPMFLRILSGNFRAILHCPRPALIVIAAVFSLLGTAPAGATEDFHDLIRREFEKYDPDYQIHRKQYGERLNAMAKALAEAQAQGRNLHCSQQMFIEAKWLHRYTAHWGRLEDKLKRIKQSLDDHDQDFATEQSPIDGFWGICYEEWFIRSSATLSALANLAARGEQPRYRLRSKGELNTGKKLLTRLQDLLISDIANTGVNNRGELSNRITTISQAAFKPHLRQILLENFDLRSSASLDTLTEAFWFFLHGAQDPMTGYWGAWYIVDGKIHKSVDLSMTYHIISYTKGRVEHWPLIIATTTAIEADPYPYGWRHKGRYNNHNIYDVAKIYKFGWPHMSEVRRSSTRKQIQSMLEWSLSNTLGPDGTFKHDPTFSDSLADEYYFGVSFLDVVGYWQPRRRFWTDAPTDTVAPALCCRLKQTLKQLDLAGWAATGAMNKLERNCGRNAPSDQRVVKAPLYSARHAEQGTPGDGLSEREYQGSC